VKKWSEQTDVDRLRNFVAALFAWLIILMGWAFFGLATLLGFWNVANALLRHSTAAWPGPLWFHCLMIVLGPFVIFMTTGQEQDFREWLRLCWRNLRNRRNDTLS
jgi:hypothetical protein